MSLHVKIYKPSRSAMQSGHAKTESWVLEYETETPRVPDPLMGWVSSEDTLNQVKLRFESMERAVEYANKKGWVFTVLPPHGRKITPRNYADNFKYFPAEENAGK